MKKFLKKITGITIITLLFPFLFTLIYLYVTNAGWENTDTGSYEKELIGKYVIMEGSGYEQTLDVEQFIPCVLMSHMSIDSPKEALKAQSVVIRTYILKYMEDNMSELSTPADTVQFYADEIGLEYIGYGELEKMWKKNFYKNYNKINSIIGETGTEIITYNEEIVIPFFHVASAGMTRNGEEVFGNDKYSYLKSVKSRDDTNVDNYIEETTYNLSEFIEKLDISDEKTKDKTVDSVQITKTCSAGYVLEVMIGEKTYSGYEIRNIFNLQSDYFSFETKDGKVKIVTNGIGHGFGLSIQGAVNMADDGSTYEEILNYYYENIKLKNE